MCKQETVTPLVSVIMPAYNAAPFIEEAVFSVLNQSISDLELIVIDDCSKDRTPDILRGLADRDGRIRVVVNDENMGVARTRNRGLSLFRGEYVAFLDSDDYWKPRMLEKMLDRAKETGADIIYCSYELVDEQGAKVCNDFLVPPATTFESSVVRSVITCSTVLITARLAAENRFPTDIYHEDIALWFQILRDGGTARGVPEVLAAYRQHSGSRSSGKLKSACRRWIIYRKHLKLPLGMCLGTMIRYGYYGVKKFRRLQPSGIRRFTSV